MRLRRTLNVILGGWMKTRKMCPNCRSTYIGLWMGTDLGVKYQCNECGYVGNIVIEEDVHAGKKRSSKNKSNKTKTFQ